MQNNAEKLRAAQLLMEEVRDTLNNEMHKCQCCGLTVYQSQVQWTQRQMLNAAISRAEKIALEMERNG